MTSNDYPFVDFFVNTNGVMLFCAHFTTPKFVPFDQKGRCTLCKSDTTDLDYVITHRGITIYCSRLKREKFVAFDTPPSIRDKRSVRIRSRGKVYNVPLSQLELYQIGVEEQLINQDTTRLFSSQPPPPPPLPSLPPSQEGLGGEGGEGGLGGPPPPPPQPGPRPGPSEEVNNPLDEIDKLTEIKEEMDKNDQSAE
jgi:hypothetical protein